MKKKSVISSLLVAVLALGALPAVQAQDHGPDHDQRGPDRDQDRDRDHGRGPEHKVPAGHEEHREQRAEGPDRGWHRGDRLPPEYRGHQYVVDNWREHRLKAPPRGYHWVQNGPDYLLVAIGSGVILQLILGH